MNNTVKITDKKATKIIAHRGVSAIELENTCAAFVAAGNHSYFGIECDVHRTADAGFVIIHDDTTGRVCDDDVCVEKSTYLYLRSLNLKNKDHAERCDLKIPTFKEYLTICKYYKKTAVVEIKNHMEKNDVFRICSVVESMDYMDNTVFISFDFDNLKFIREKYPHQQIQFLTSSLNDEIINKLVEYKMDLDIKYRALNQEIIQDLHSKGIKVNCWTVNDPDDAQRLINAGVDFITTNILE